MENNHFIKMCSECGTVIAQCRCLSANKTLTHGICDKCQSINNSPAPADKGEVEELVDILNHVPSLNKEQCMNIASSLIRLGYSKSPKMVWPEVKPLNALRNLQAKGWNDCLAACKRMNGVS